MKRNQVIAGAVIAGFALLASGIFAVSGLVKVPIDYALNVWRALSRIRPDLNARAKLIIIAQGAFETGWGMKGTAPIGFNYWNVTVGSGFVAKGSTYDGRSYILGGDTDGKGNKIVQKWRRYRSVEEGVLDFLTSFIAPGTRYAKAYTALLTGNVRSYVTELRAGGYFTAPLEDYVTNVDKIVTTAETILKKAGIAV